MSVEDMMRTASIGASKCIGHKKRTAIVMRQTYDQFATYRQMK